MFALLPFLLLSAPLALAADNSSPQEKSPSRTDSLGDALPPGALLRLGTERLRHGFDVAAVAFSSDGKVLASGSRDKTVRLWDPNTGKELLRMTADHEVTRIAFAPDGKSLAAATNSGKVIFLWDTTTGKELQTFQGHTALVHGLAFSPDGKVLASGGWDTTLRFWDVATAKEIGKAKLDRLSIFTLAFAPDGKTVATGTGSLPGGSPVRMWEVPSGKEVRSFTGQAGAASAVVFSPDGKLLASAGDSPNQTIHLWDAATGKKVNTVPGHKWGVRSLAFSPDGKTLASADHSFTMVWDVNTGKHLLTMTGSGDFVAFAPDGKTLAAVSRRQIIRLFDPATGKERLSLGRHEGGVFALAFSPDNKAVVTNDQKAIRFWDPGTGKLLRQMQETKDFIYGFAMAPDGKTLAASCLDRTVRYWETATGKETARYAVDEFVTPLAFSPDGKLLALGGARIRLWQAGTDKEVSRIEHVANPLIFSPDGKVLASGVPWVPGAPAGPEDNNPRLICLWDVSTGKRLFQLPEHCTLLAFSPDGRILVSTDGKSLHGWETATGKKFFTIPVPEAGVNALAFSPDGRLVATGTWKGTINLYDVATGKEVSQLPGHAAPVRSLAFSLAGKTLASGSDDTTALVWDVTETARRFALPAQDLAAQELEKLWLDLGEMDSATAYQAIVTLARGRNKAVAYLKEHLGPPKGVDAKRLRALIVDLDSDRFEVREAASRELKKLGVQTRPGLEEGLKGTLSLEARKRLEELLDAIQISPLDSATLRGVRSIQVLEFVGSPEAQQVLECLARGATEARVTHDARLALERLSKRPPAPR